MADSKRTHRHEVQPFAPPLHPQFSRRTALQAGAIGLLGLGANHLAALRAGAAEAGAPVPRAKTCIFIFLSGGLAQHESFDPKPDASDEFRGEFDPISTATPGLQICEHLPMLAARSEKWAICRSLTHPYNEHSQGHMAMLSGITAMPTGFSPQGPKPTDHPAIAAIASDITRPRNNLPPAVVLPEKLIHYSGRVIPGQFAGTMGARREPYFVTASRYNPQTYGAWPEYGFHHERGVENPPGFAFQAPNLSLPEGFTSNRLGERVNLLQHIEAQQRQLDGMANVEEFDRYRQRAISMLADGKMAQVFNVTNADHKTLDRYGRNTFGWSLLLARRLVEAGVNLVQVNLGNNETWDTHQAAFRNLKNFLLPPMDRSVSALIDDLDESGLLDDTLIVMAGEFGRKPKITTIPGVKLAGRDHWGAVQSVFFAGGGIRGGTVCGASDKIGGFPISDPQRPENMAATIYQCLGIPRHGAWHDMLDRPIPVYNGEPIQALL